MTNKNTNAQSTTIMLIIRSAIGGILMGLANLVPGISGGTMLLASGVYLSFVDAIAEITSLKFRSRSILLLVTIAAAAGIVILTLAGPVRDLVVNHRWIMFSLFIGLTLGGVPLVWKMLKPININAVIATLIATTCMVILALLPEQQNSTGDINMLLLVIAGIAGASAMILPGVSGGYLLLLLGQYLVILGAIHQFKEGLSAQDTTQIFEAMKVVIPVGIGVVIGIAGVSNLIKLMLNKCEKITLGLLLGLLLGSVVGLYPYRAYVQPQPGDTIKGQIVTTETIDRIDKEDWQTQSMEWTEIGSAKSAIGLLLILAGFGFTQAIALIGKDNTNSITN